MKLLLIAVLTLTCQTSMAQLSKIQVAENIDNWYIDNPNQYSVEISGDAAQANITRYHPERADEKNDLIEINYKGMQIEMKFSKPLAEISTHKDSLQKYFSYVSFHNIYNEIEDDGWDVYPQTSQSSMNGEGVVFSQGGDPISLRINWSTYTVMGYKDSKKCHNELGIADGSVSDECYVSVRDELPLEVDVTDVKLTEK